MPHASVGGVKLYYEEAGQGRPLVFVHEFAGDGASWRSQVSFFARRYRTIAFNARGYPPSDVPEDPGAYSQRQAAEDVRGVLDHLGIAQAHVCGLSMGGYATLHFGLEWPERALSLTIAGCGYGSAADRETFRQDSERVAQGFERDIATAGDAYSRGPYRVQFLAKDPVGWQEFHDRLVAGSGPGHALTLRGVQMRRPSVLDLGDRMARLRVPALIVTGDEDERRPSVLDLGDRMARLRVPALIVTGDEDEPCLEPGLFMKRKLPAAGLLVIPNSGHTINLEEPDAFNRGLLDFLAAVDAGRWPERR
ncbi:MAG: alpha/beta hydrolase [Candidatus Rokubacteria bacterium]|nr:alpha/beta hydrolase [Candidatus Rokubacteria bacterium]